MRTLERTHCAAPALGNPSGADRRGGSTAGSVAVTLYLASFALFSAFLAAVLTYTGAWSADLSRISDEASHFVNSAMLRDYALHAFGSNPIRFALDYYGHLPRVSIGHWPPLFHLVQGGVFLLAGSSFTAALGFQVVIAASTAALTATLVKARVGDGARGTFVGVVAGLAVLLSPDVFGAVGMVMLDMFLALLVLLTCLAWAGYARTGRTAGSIAFALCASAAILTKGNGYGLGLLPVLYVALSGQIALAANWRTWLAAAIVLLLTVPWYALTYKITADGFTYAWGLDYTLRAIPGYALAAVHSLGPIVCTAFGLGAALIARRAWRGERDETALACASAAIGLLLFNMAVPSDITSRYLVAAVPTAVVVATLGLAGLASGLRRPSGRLAWIPAMAISGVLGLNAALIFRAPPVSTQAMSLAARDILASPGPAPLVLIAAGSKGEGMLIAAFAALDPTHAHYVIRASKALAASNFLGSDYRARFGDAEDVQRWVVDNRIAWLVLDDGPDSMAMLHDEQLAALAAAGQPGWEPVSKRAFGKGSVSVFRLHGPPPTPVELAAVLHQVAPDKVIGGKPG